MAEYISVPVEAAAVIAREFSKSQVVIISLDPLHRLVHTTTFGVSASDKVEAARAGDFLAEQLGLDLAQRNYVVDFRDEYQPALYREALDLLKLIRNRNGCTPQMVQQAERILNAAGEGVRAG